MIYLDNAATSFPKAPGVAEATAAFLRTSAGNPGRSGHSLSLAAGRCVEDCRRQVARLLGVADEHRVVFTLNATDALNMALKGVLRPGDHVVTTSMEHNAVARPLRRARQEGVEVTYVQAGPDGILHPDPWRAAFRPNTRLAVFLHASNVTGALQPLEALATAAREAGALVLVDAAQSAGAVPLDLGALPVDLLACSAHKGLLGPTGVGILVVGERADVRPLREGGTGSRSESDEHPQRLPDRLEAGTPNTVGLAGLLPALAFIAERTIAGIRQEELGLSDRLFRGVAAIDRVVLYGPPEAERRAAAVSLNIAGADPQEVAGILDATFGIAVRAGLHCAPLAHRTIGTFPGGTVRLSPGPFTTDDEIQTTLEAVRTIAQSL